ncbi:phage tail assembly protein [Kitasatospora purpeofusca]|uniref:phage tail assembly protein n=1 Tax=Kitasatospora purpeofusca TaxID=67352 RepID=UPI002E12D904|nr:phage tail assembly protein [Kitasatospora purpeofusca]
MTVLSCADLLAEVEREYTALPIATRAGASVTLRNLLLLSPEGMNSARILLGAIDSGSDDDLGTIAPQLRDLLLLVATDPKALAAEMEDWPLGMHVRVIQAWQEATQPGEAPDSAS